MCEKAGIDTGAVIQEHAAPEMVTYLIWNINSDPNSFTGGEKHEGIQSLFYRSMCSNTYPIDLP